MKTLWMMVGVPGSGKSWFAKNILIPFNDCHWAYISRDQIRFDSLEEGEDYFTHENEVFETFVRIIAQHLNDEITKNVVADATHLNWKSRRKLLNALARYVDMSNVDVLPVVVCADLDTCLARNSERTGREFVPKGVIRRMAYQITNPQDDPYDYCGQVTVMNGEVLNYVYEDA